MFPLLFPGIYLDALPHVPSSWRLFPLQVCRVSYLCLVTHLPSPLEIVFSRYLLITSVVLSRPRYPATIQSALLSSFLVQRYQLWLGSFLSACSLRFDDISFLESRFASGRCSIDPESEAVFPVVFEHPRTFCAAFMAAVSIFLSDFAITKSCILLRDSATYGTLFL